MNQTERERKCKQWIEKPLTIERAKEIIDRLAAHDDEATNVALIELLCGLSQNHGDGKFSPDEHDPREVAYQAMLHVFTYTMNFNNAVADFLTEELNCAEGDKSAA